MSAWVDAFGGDNVSDETTNEQHPDNGLTALRASLGNMRSLYPQSQHIFDGLTNALEELYDSRRAIRTLRAERDAAKRKLVKLIRVCEREEEIYPTLDGDEVIVTESAEWFLVQLSRLAYSAGSIALSKAASRRAGRIREGLSEAQS